MVQKELGLAEPSVFFLFTCIVVIVPLQKIPSFVNWVGGGGEITGNAWLSLVCRRVVSSSDVNRLYPGDGPLYSNAHTHTHKISQLLVQVSVCCSRVLFRGVSIGACHGRDVQPGGGCA